MGPNGEELDTVAIVTTDASADLSALHHRVPVTIAPGDFERWLDCRNDEVEPALTLLRLPRAGEFVWHPVSKRVNRAANGDAQLLLPIGPEEMEAQAARPASRAARRAVPAAIDDGQGSLF